jgi:hypothetical protein
MFGFHPLACACDVFFVYLSLSPEQVVWAPGQNIGFCLRALLLLISFHRSFLLPVHLRLDFTAAADWISAQFSSGSLVLAPSPCLSQFSFSAARLPCRSLFCVRSYLRK